MDISGILDTATGPPVPSENLNGTTVFHYVNAFNDGQFFWKESGQAQSEKPGSDVGEYQTLFWCGSLRFVDYTEGSHIGYTGHCVRAILDGVDEVIDAGAQPYVKDQFVQDFGMSAVYVPQKNVFECQYHANIDNSARRLWDDGRPSMHGIAWETHDEGDLSPDAATSAFSAVQKVDWISVAEAASLVGRPASELSPERFDEIYAITWIKNHEEEAEVKNPYPDAELAVIEEVKEDLGIDGKDVNDTNATDIPAALGLDIMDLSDIEATKTATKPPAPGKNINGTSVFNNYINAVNDGQFFWKATVYGQYEMPGSEATEGEELYWCGNLHFNDFESGSPALGYTGNCVTAFTSGLDKVIDAGAQLTFEEVQDQFVFDSGVSFIYVPQTNVFEGQLHANADNAVWRAWDDGRPSMNGMVWETHDEGDMDSNAATSAWSSVRRYDWLTVSEAASLIGTIATSLTPEIFDEVYANTWLKTHEEETAVNNPNPGAEQEIVDQVKESLANDTNANKQLALDTTDISALDANVTAASLAAPGENLEGTSIFRNFIRAFEDGQFFWRVSGHGQFEKPFSDIVEFELLYWCSNLHFTNFTEGSPIGYTGNCVADSLKELNEAAEAGAQLTLVEVKDQFMQDSGISAVYIPQTNIFEGQSHANTDNYVWRFWDDGGASMQTIIWEVHDEGDLTPNMATSSFSGVYRWDWISVEEASALIGLSTSDITPESFEEIYANTWIKK
ncbi:hypothetical protein ACHAWF_011546 [Thalassiosira exigua]